MQEEQQNTHQSPFAHGLFFPDSGRSAALEALRGAVTSSASLITCLGEEGFGKTTLYKILEKELQEPYLVISFPSSVESFDYVLQMIAIKLNLNFSMKNNTLGSGHLLMEIANTLHERGKRLLILFDEAEKLYLATLERIRKMIDLANEHEVLLQIILFGRMGLQAHIEQLAQCTFKSIQEAHLVLPPLTEEDTFRYLNFCMQQQPGIDKKDIFSREVAAKILAMSHGNFRKINTLASDSLRSSSYKADDTSFMVLLEHVQDADIPIPPQTPVRRLPFPMTQKKIFIGAGVLALGIILLISTRNEPVKTTPPSATEKHQTVVQPKKQLPDTNRKETSGNPDQPAPPPTTEPVAPPKPAQPPPAAATAAVPSPQTPPTTVAPAPTPPTVASTTSPPPQTAAPAPDTKTAPPTQPAPMAVTAKAATAATTTPATATPPGTTPAQPTTPAQSTLPAATTPTTATTAPAQTSPDPHPSSVKISPLVEKESSTTQVIAAGKFPKKNTIPHLTPERFTKHKDLLNAKKDPAPAPSLQLPRKNIAAGDKWLAGDKNDRFTLQLMILADDQAGEKLKTILLDTDHQKGADEFIVLKKPTSPSAFMLFYGEYPTLAAARSARDNLPQSLQKYTPYPISIKQAVEKSKRQ